MKIITLMDNLVYKTGLTSEHGLSIYIETDNKKLLFDTGQTSAFITNAEKLGIDISAIDALIISHGHYDHTGGLSAFLQHNSKAKIFLKKEVFIKKYHLQKFIGTRDDLDLFKDRVVFIDRITEVGHDIFVVPEIPIIDSNDTSFSGFYIDNGNGFEKDIFLDELFIAITALEKITIISSCSHRGITNIARKAIDSFHLPVHMIIGGFHLTNCTKEQYKNVLDYFRSINPDCLAVCHCTGIEKYSELLHDDKFRIIYNPTGNVIDI